MQDWIALALSIVGGISSVIVAIGSGLTVRLLRHIDDLEEAKESHATQIRDTRQAISRIEGKLNMDPFPYTS